MINLLSAANYVRGFLIEAMKYSLIFQAKDLLSSSKSSLMDFENGFWNRFRQGLMWLAEILQLNINQLNE